MEDFKLVIMDRGAAADYLRKHEVNWAISIGDPASLPPPHLPRNGTLRLEFKDVLRSYASRGEFHRGPDRNHIQAILDFSSEVEGGHMLMHCHAGISRSTAAAFIFMCLKMGPGREVEALDYVVGVRRCANPNRMMVKLADEMMSRDGRMVRAVEEYVAADEERDPSRLWEPFVV